MKDCEVSTSLSGMQTLSRTKFYFGRHIVLQKLATVNIVPAVLLHLPLLMLRRLLLLRPLPQADEHASKKKTKTANNEPSGCAAGIRKALVLLDKKLDSRIPNLFKKKTKLSKENN